MRGKGMWEHCKGTGAKPMPEQQAGNRFEQPTRNHVTFIAEKLGILFFFVLIFSWNSLGEAALDIFTAEFWRKLLQSASLAAGVQYFIGAGAFFFVLLLVAIFAFIAWRRTFFYLQEDCLIYEKRTLMKRYSKLPLQNIASVNLERNVFERIVGTSKVKIDINSAQTANKTGFTIILNQALAQQFHDALTLRRQALAQGDAYTAQPLQNTQSPILTTPRREVISFTNGQAIVHMLLSAPVLQAIFVLFSFVTPLLGREGDMDHSTILSSALFFIVLGCGAWIFSALRLFRYRVERDAHNIYITSGLLKQTSYAFHESRIHAVWVRQPLLARLFRLYFIEVAVVGLGNEKNETPQLCLLTNHAQMQRVLAECAPRFVGCKGYVIPQHKAALFPLCFWTLLLCMLSLLLLLIPITNAWMLPLAFSLLCIVGAALNYRTKSVAMDSELFTYSSGIFSNRSGYFRYSTIQDVNLRSNFLLKRSGAARMTLTLLSGAKQKMHHTGWFAYESLEKAALQTVAHADSAAQLLQL